MKYSHILWDFNGTILDDVGIGIESINALLSSCGLPVLQSREEYQRHFCFPIETYYRNVGFDFSKTPYDVLAHEWIAQYRAREQTAPLCPGAREMLDYIKGLNIPQILFSATQRDMLLQQITALGIGDCFDAILGTDDIYAAGKIPIGKAWVKSVRPDRALLIGDTEHDAEAAREMGIECVLIAQGHQPETALTATGCPVLPNLFALPDFLRKTADAPFSRCRKEGST